MLNSAGLVPERDLELVMMDGVDDAILSVFARKADACVIGEYFLKFMSRETAEMLRVVVRGRPYPAGFLLVRSDLGDGRVARISEAVFAASIVQPARGVFEELKMPPGIVAASEADLQGDSPAQSAPS